MRIPQSRLTLISFGGGQDSTDIIYSICEDKAFRREYAPQDICCIMSDSGNEHPLTYAHVALIADYLQAHGIPFYFVTPDMGFHTPAWQSLTGQFERSSTVGIVGVTRSCTVNLKIGPIYKCLEAHVAATYGYKAGNKQALKAFARDWGKIQILVGISRGEETRAKYEKALTQAWMKESLFMRYPLIEVGRDRQDCQEHIRSLGHEVPPPSNCMLCHFMTPIELLWLHRHYPLMYAKWVELERVKMSRPEYQGPNAKKNSGVFGSKTISEVLEAAVRRFGHLSDQEIEEYKFSHGHSVKSSY